MAVRKFGEVSEWPKEHAWKVCIRKRIEGSNPSLTAILKKPRNCGAFFMGGGKGVFLLSCGEDEIVGVDEVVRVLSYLFDLSGWKRRG